MSKNLTVQYDKMLYLIEDSEYSRSAIGKYIDVWRYPDGHKELRLNGVLLPYSTYDRLSEVDPVAILDNKRLDHVLDVARYGDNTASLSPYGWAIHTGRTGRINQPAVWKTR